MAYRSRINLDDPRLQTSLRNATKGNAAIPGASSAVRGLFSSYGESEGSRLSQADLGGRKLKNTQQYYDAANKLASDKLSFNTALQTKQYKMDKGRLKDARLGSMIGLGIGALNTGINLYGAHKDRLAREKQTQFTNAMIKQWADDNPIMANKYAKFFPDLNLRRNIPFPNRATSQYGDARR